MATLRTLILTLVVISVLLVAGCAPGGTKEYTSPSQPIEVKIGESFMITLESNPTTGYKWESGFDQNLLKLMKSEFKQDASKPGMVGVGGREQFTFAGLKAGDAQVKMTYKRPWEQQSADAKVLTFTVKIKK